MEEKTIFMFGAGASSASGFSLPVMKGFFQKDTLKKDSYPNLILFLENYFIHVPIQDLNLESVVTALELACDSFASFGKPIDTYIYAARREFDAYVIKRLETPERHCKIYQKLLSAELAGKDSKDTIITLNYDLIVDRTLYGFSPKQSNGRHIEHGCLLERTYQLLGHVQLYLGERPSLYHAYKSLGFYLKLHGSVDWLYCPNTQCKNHLLFFPNWLGVPSIKNDPGDLCNFCGSGLVSVIVPPTLSKSFSKYPKLGFLWSLAFRELNTAGKIVVFGLSFAESDYYLTWLLNKAISDRINKPQIFNINPDKSSTLRIRQITGLEPSHHDTLEDFLEVK